MYGGTDGSLNVGCGPMGGQKSWWCINHFERARGGAKKVIAFMHKDGLRPELILSGNENRIISRNGAWIPAEIVKTAREISMKVRNQDVIIIDEGQFFDRGLLTLVETYADEGREVYVAGLEKDRERKPFLIMPDLLALADTRDTLYPVCVNFKCGKNATHTSFVGEDDGEQVKPGIDNYIPTCRNCWKILKADRELAEKVLTHAHEVWKRDHLPV